MSVAELSSKIALDRQHQLNAVRRTMMALLGEQRKGVVLADEVGCGKTYEALAVAALLWAHHACEPDESRHIRRILVLADGALMHKWFNEIEVQSEAAAKGAKKGFSQYVRGTEWKGFRDLLEHAVTFTTKRDGDARGVVERGKRQVPPGRLYITKQSLLWRDGAEDARQIRYVRNTDWDLVIVDEAHNYCGLHTQRSRIFFPDQTLDSRADGLSSRYILALTATPFQLATKELLNLLRIVEADAADVAQLADGLPRYERALEAFHDRRHVPPNDETRRRAVGVLRELRSSDASGGTRPGTLGLEPLLRRYVIRNVKDPGARRYRMSERLDGKIGAREFGKLDDVKSLIRESPLVPLSGPHAWIYMQVRDLIDDAHALARDDETRRPTFVAGDLRQCLSSYRQLLDSALLTKKKLPRSPGVVRAIQKLEAAGELHPKVSALCDVVDELLAFELERIRSRPAEPLGKILVFNTLRGTAKTLGDALNARVAARLDPFIAECLQRVGWADVDAARHAVRAALELELPVIRERLERERGAEFLSVDAELLKHTGVEVRADSKNLVDIMFHRLRLHCEQPLFLMRLARSLHASGVEHATVEDVAHFLASRVTERLWHSLNRIVDDFLDDTPISGERFDELNRERARREIRRLAQILGSGRYVARFDGATGDDDRERNKENFNRPYAPLVLLVSKVGEEGIDLQAHTRYVLHYDIEWNPAKMEQREGRVDREGRKTKDPVRVQFFLLKDTYEERVFHTVMQRHLWFEILIGSRKKELAKKVDVDTESTDDADLGAEEIGTLTATEREAVILNLEP